MIAPGALQYLKRGIAEAEAQKADALVVKLNTPGGMLNTAQEMIQAIFQSSVPVIIYVSPSGGTATSAGVFITMAGHVAAMAPGTSIGSAHPVMGDGKDIEGDMRKKAENMTVALVKSIAEQRKRNADWAEKSVTESVSITASDALRMGVVDLVAKDLDELLAGVRGKEVKLPGGTAVLPDLGQARRTDLSLSVSERLINTLAEPNILALLWLGATTGLSIELYSPGAILPGVVGVICLILALLVSQVIPVSYGAVLLLVVGVFLIALEIKVTSGILGIGGLVSIVLGSIYLIDSSKAPGMAVNMSIVLPAAIGVGVLLLAVVYAAARVQRKKRTTGFEGLIGQHGTAKETVAKTGTVFVNGELWQATVNSGVIQKDELVEVVGVADGLTLEVRKIS